MKCAIEFVIGGNSMEGELAVSAVPISFFGDVDPDTGIIKDPNSNLKGKSIAGKILVAPGTRGSTVGPYVIFALAKHGVAPKAIIVKNAEPILITGSVIAELPLAKCHDESAFDTALNGRHASIDSKSSLLLIE